MAKKTKSKNKPALKHLWSCDTKGNVLKDMVGKVPLFPKVNMGLQVEVPPHCKAIFNMENGMIKSIEIENTTSASIFAKIKNSDQ